MSSKIYKIDKDSLTEIDSVSLAVSNVQSVIIQHVYDSTISDASIIPFQIDIADGHAPYIHEEEFMVVIRERVDATSRGVNDIEITNAGEDIGEFNHKNRVPYRPWELPQGFRELRGKNE
jgi:hypothetical protein